VNQVSLVRIIALIAQWCHASRPLEKDIKAAAEKQDGPKTRMAAVKAAAVSRNPRTSEAYKSAS
jgi:hypothetical protein